MRPEKLDKTKLKDQFFRALIGRTKREEPSASGGQVPELMFIIAGKRPGVKKEKLKEANHGGRFNKCNNVF